MCDISTSMTTAKKYYTQTRHWETIQIFISYHRWIETLCFDFGTISLRGPVYADSHSAKDLCIPSMRHTWIRIGACQIMGQVLAASIKLRAYIQIYLRSGVSDKVGNSNKKLWLWGMIVDMKSLSSIKLSIYGNVYQVHLYSWTT